MRKFLFGIGTLLVATSGFCDKSYYFVDEDHPLHLDTDFRYVGNAKLKSHRYDNSHVKFADSWNTLYYSFFIDPKNSLSIGLGYNYLKFDWDKNPRFSGEDYNYASASLTWISRSTDRWRWLITGGVTVDTKDFNFQHTAVGYAFMWGRYTVTEDLGAHIGFIGYAGVRNGYALPVLGFDWQISRAWRLHAIFPLDLSLRLYLSENWFVSLMYSGFGPYRYPRRAHGGIGAFDDAIFQVSSSGTELNLTYFKGNMIEAGLGGGWNYGGWLLVKDKHNHHGKYYKYKGAPYGHAYLAFNF